ncbi:Protein takeout [Gryllus bimaculatus]|nr:Protein takeout [Gryllus bimaculatus]
MRPDLLILLVVAVSCSVNGVAANKLPESYPLCKKTDPKLNECIEKAAHVVLPQLKDGIPSINVPSIDPLKVTTINIGQGHGPISINIKFSDITVTGLSDAQVHKADIDLKKYSLNFKGAIQNVSLVSQYEMTGRILLLPVTGQGPCKLTFTNIQANLGPKGKGVTKKGKNYFDVTDFFLDINGLDKLQVQFDNLFNGDKTLGKSMNNLLNENWKDLWSELKPAFDEVFGEVFHQYSKGIFSGVAFDEIFLD